MCTKMTSERITQENNEESYLYTFSKGNGFKTKVYWTRFDFGECHLYIHPVYKEGNTGQLMNPTEIVSVINNVLDSQGIKVENLLSMESLDIHFIGDFLLNWSNIKEVLRVLIDDKKWTWRKSVEFMLTTYGIDREGAFIDAVTFCKSRKHVNLLINTLSNNRYTNISTNRGIYEINKLRFLRDLGTKWNLRCHRKCSVYVNTNDPMYMEKVKDIFSPQLFNICLSSGMPDYIPILEKLRSENYGCWATSFMEKLLDV